ncbi:MAG: cupin domain-containing protein [Sulfurovum sp.]|jgi:cupin 2 domain-containing protein
MKENIFENIKVNKDKEQFNDIINTKDVRIERIVSNGQTSEQDFWYDQNENEFVVVLKGRAILQIKQNNEIKEYVLNEGDYLNIQANIKHRVKYTSLDEPTVWLAVFYK